MLARFGQLSRQALTPCWGRTERSARAESSLASSGLTHPGLAGREVGAVGWRPPVAGPEEGHERGDEEGADDEASRSTAMAVPSVPVPLCQPVHGTEHHPTTVAVRMSSPQEQP